MIIVTSADNNFALPATVMMRSVVDHLGGTRGAELYVLDCGLTPASRRKMRRSISRLWVDMHFIPVVEDRLKGFRVDGHVTSAAYARLLMGHLLPAELDRVIYMDGDLLALADLRPLWEMDLQGHPMAAVQDPVGGLVGRSAQMMHWQGWDVPEGTLYFNSGLMVFDLDRWRKEGLFERAIRVAREHPDRMRWWDQCALNHVIRGDYAPVDPAWNVLPQLYYPPNRQDVLYGREVVERCIAKPRMLHFSGGHRPWKGPGRHWREAEFYRYLYRTAWRYDVYCAPWMGRGNSAWTKVKRTMKGMLGKKYA